MKTLILPKKLEPELRKVWGRPFFGKKTEISEKFKLFCQRKKFKKIITVGDYCSLILPSDIKIFDGRIKRKKIKLPQTWKKNCLLTDNPRGTIQNKTWGKIRKAIREKKNVFVKGEEDLLVIPCVITAEKDSAVVYGFPDKGVCLIEPLSQTKKVFKKLLKKFQTK